MMNKRITAGILTASLAAGALFFTPAAAFAGEQTNLRVGIPKKYDLRSVGVVTPVKQQNPFSTCWAFGGIAAAESSILSSEGKTYAETVGADGKGFDLSEKHVSWFATEPLTKADDKSQAGEGIYEYSREDPQSRYDTGGFSFYVSSLFASGAGPVAEKEIPYQGKNGVTEYEFRSSMTQEEADEYYTQVAMEVAEENGETLEEYVARRVNEEGLAEGLSDYDPLRLYLDWLIEANLEFYKEHDSWSKDDDWALPAVYKDKNGKVVSNRNRFGGYTLKDGNVLPELCNVTYDENRATEENLSGARWEGINPDGIRAAKQEILDGRAVSVGFLADESVPNEQGEGKYMNENTWAHYSYEYRPSNHVVCIVGWDDDYSRLNFNASHRPPGNGAWLVKNSWGSETEYKTRPDGIKIGKGDWGIVDENGNHTGYFWLSYYDKTLNDPETLEFTKSNQNQMRIIKQYDYMPAVNFLAEDDDAPMRTANIFPSKKSDGDLRVTSISTQAATENTRATISVYRLNKNYKNPMDGKLVYQTSKNFAYRGYHRIDIPDGEQFVQKGGETLSVVTTQSLIDEDTGEKFYWFSVSAGLKEGTSYADNLQMYEKAVVNPGESYLFSEGSWKDWAAEKTSYEEEEDFVFDNFSTKIMGTLASKMTQKVTVKDKSVSVTGKAKDGKLTKNSSKSSVTKGVKTSGDGKLSYTKKSGDKGIVVTSDGKVYAKKGIKTGTYKITVTVKASKTDTYAAASKNMKVTIKVKGKQ